MVILHHEENDNAARWPLSGRGKIKPLDRARLLLAAGLLASLVVFVVIAVFAGAARVLSEILHARVYIYALAFASVTAAYSMRFWKWDYYTRILKLRVPRRKNFLVYLSTYSMKITPGGIGTVIAAYTLKRMTKRGFMRIVPIVAMNLFTDYMSFALLALVAALYTGRYVIYVAALATLLVIPFLLLMQPHIFNRLRARAGRRTIVGRAFTHAGRYYSALGALNKPKVYIVSLCLSLPADFTMSLALFLTLRSLGIRSHIALSTFVFSASQIIGMVSTLPGGLGAAEVSYVALLRVVMGLSVAVGSAAAIMTRLATLWFGVILGTVVLVYTMRYWRKRTNASR